MNNEIEKLEVKKILDNLEYVSDIHKVFIEDGYKIQEEIPSSQIKELRLNSYNAKLLFNHINNLQSKIDRAIEYIDKHFQDDEGIVCKITGEYEAERNETFIKEILDILKEVENVENN